jgi:hypothetical protein
MELTFRTIKGTTFKLEAEPTTSVGDLKTALEASQGSTMPKDLVKLVYKGKVLDDNSKAISDYNVDETGFLVVFVQKKTEAKPAAAAAGGASSSQPAAAEVRPCSCSPLCLQQHRRCYLQFACRGSKRYISSSSSHRLHHSTSALHTVTQCLIC